MPDCPDWVRMVQIAVTVNTTPVVPRTDNEVTVIKPGRLTTSSNEYAAITSYEVTDGCVLLLASIEIASDNYALATFKLTIDDVVIFTDKQFLTSFNPIVANVAVTSLANITVFGKSDGATSITMDASIEGKEVS